MHPHVERQYRLLCSALDRCPPAIPCAGEGIVTCGDQKFVPYLWLLVRSLRYHGSELPIELWHMEGEVNEALRSWLEPYGVKCCLGGPDGWSGAVDVPRDRAAHGFKVQAILASSFRHVLFLDADNTAVRRPDFLFRTPQYLDKAALFWSDHDLKTPPLDCSELYDAFEVVNPNPPGVVFESGQMVVDKLRHWRALNLALHFNREAGFYYRHTYGDKDTFRLAFDYCKIPYCLVPHSLPMWGTPERHFRHGYAYQQGWVDATPLFFHRVSAYKFAINLRSRFSHDIPVAPPEVVEDWIAELDAMWPQVVPTSVARFYRRTSFRMRGGELKRRVMTHMRRCLRLGPPR